MIIDLIFALMFTGYVILMFCSLGLLLDALLGEGIIREEGPWIYTRYHDMKREAFWIKMKDGTLSHKGFRIFTTMVHVNPACHDTVAFNEACMVMYGTKRDERHEIKVHCGLIWKTVAKLC